ncbi:MAG: outer membrane lipoprotein carrier protein LolA [Reyranella sp.]|nr:outer membrane lipoprotein carrier protein LolA [Reyranella sp.]
MLDSAAIGRHMQPMRILIATLLLSFSTFLAAGPANAQGQGQNAPVVAEVEKYFNAIRTLKARFVQSNPNGSVVQGTLYIRRPGRMRFEYDAPSQLKIVADGYQVTMWDIATKDFGQWPIGWTAASFLVKEPLSLTGDLQVDKIDRTDNMIQLTMSQARKPQEGKVIVRLGENPMVLRGWTIIDNRGNHVNVSLVDVQSGLQLADSLFKFDGPDPGAIRRGGN